MKLLDSLVYEQFELPDWFFASQQDSTESGNYSSDDKIKTTCLVIEDETNFYYQARLDGQQGDLLAKMLSAIQISGEQFNCVASTQKNLTNTLANYQAQVVLIIGEGLAIKQDNVFECSHPQDILANPQLKRDTWEILKQIKQCVKI